MTNTNTLQASFEHFATSDLRTARKEGNLLIGGTQRGTLGLSYSRATKTYTLATQGLDSSIVAEGKAGTVKKALAGLYTVSHFEA